MDKSGYVFWCSKCKKSHAGDCAAKTHGISWKELAPGIYQYGATPPVSSPAGLMAYMPATPPVTDVTMFQMGFVKYSIDNGVNWYDGTLSSVLPTTHVMIVTAVNHQNGTVTMRVEKK